MILTLEKKGGLDPETGAVVGDVGQNSQMHHTILCHHV